MTDRAAILEQANARYAALRADPATWAEIEAERAEWDVTLMDGLEREDAVTADFSYAYCLGLDDLGRATMQLWVDERGGAPPDGYTPATYPQFREAWRMKHTQRYESLVAGLRQSPR